MTGIQTFFHLTEITTLYLSRKTGKLHFS